MPLCYDFSFIQKITNNVSNFHMRIFSPHYNFMSFWKMPNQVIVKQYFQCNLKIDILFDQFNKILYSIWRFIFYHIFISIVRYLNVWIIFLMCHQSTKIWHSIFDNLQCQFKKCFSMSVSTSIANCQNATLSNV